MGVVVQFDFAALTAQFPAMTAVGTTLCQQYWDIATTMHANDGTGPVANPAIQMKLLNMLTAHIAQLFAPKDADGNPDANGTYQVGLTGRVSSASEGSVSVQTEALQGFSTAQASWLSMTPYGALYWAATAGYRTFRYRRPATAGITVAPLRFNRG